MTLFDLGLMQIFAKTFVLFIYLVYLWCINLIFIKVKTFAQFKNRCLKLGVTYENNGYALIITAPHGKVFASYGTHDEAIFFYDGWNCPEIYEEFIHIMRDGLLVCEDVECEFCNEK